VDESGMMNDAFGTRVIEWPYPIQYNEEENAEYDVLVLGGGISGCWAAISAARKGANVALVEKGATKRSGAGGSGTDHWNFATDNPCSRITPEEMTRIVIDSSGGYSNAIIDYIMCSTSYETLSEMEKIGGKVRDVEGDFKGADFRDEKTKLLFAYDYDTRFCIRIWGTTFKPALYQELKRLRVKIFNRVMATSLLSQNGEQGDRIIGATGLNVRTGKFYVFKAKAIILCMALPTRNWNFSTELKGLSQFYPPNRVGNGHAMAWRAGAELTMMEKSVRSHLDDGNRYPNYGTGNPSNTWYPCTMVDANDKKIPWVDRDGNILKTFSERCHPSPKQKYLIPLFRDPHHFKYALPRIIPDLKTRIEKGEFTLPLYADLTCMPEHERRVIWGIMVGEEAKTKVPILDTYTQAGFDPNRDMLQSYYMLRGDVSYGITVPQERVFIGGGLVVDWDLKTSLEGLYAAGEQAFSCQGAAGAATSGRWSGRKAAEYALRAKKLHVYRRQIEREKARVYTPVFRKDGIDWKEFSAGLCRIMQHYCSEPKTEILMNIGLSALKGIEEGEAQKIYADNPHKLMRALDVLDILTCDQVIINACLSRKASSQYLNFIRLDYPEEDPKEWHKFITIKNKDGQVKVGEKPIEFYEPLKENYETHYGSQ